MLMGTDDGGIDHRIFVVGIFCQMLENPFPDAAFRPSLVTAVSVLPVAKNAPADRATECPLGSGTTPPSRTAVVFCRHADRLFTARKQLLDPRPLIIPQSIPSHHS